MNRRDLERQVDEELATKYYHASDAELPIGAVLESRGSQGRTPRLVDDLRPPGTPPRNKHLFMVKDPACLEELGQWTVPHVYRVTPAAPVVKADFGWIPRTAMKSPFLGSKRERDANLEAAGWESDMFGLRWHHPDLPGVGGLSFAEAERYLAAMNYWRGVPTDPCNDEYLTMTFRVEEKVK